MLAFLLGATTLMVIHHIFYMHLNKKRIDPGSTDLPALLTNQKAVNFIGTTIAHGARILFAMTIGVSFTQMFWETLRSQTNTIAQVDALHRCGQSPFSLSAHQAARVSFKLYTTALAASATSLVVVLSPGSLTISPDFQQKNCVVPTVPESVATLQLAPDLVGTITMASFITNAVLSNSYIPPLQVDLISTCGIGFSTCSYNVSFYGPALDCMDVTNKTNFTSFLAPEVGSNQTAIWQVGVNSDSMGMTVLSRDEEKGSLQATSCGVFGAIYDATVILERSTQAQVQVQNVVYGSSPINLSISTHQQFAAIYVLSILGGVTGSCFIDPNGPPGCILGSFLVSTSTNNYTFSDTPQHFLTSLIQNASISLLSGNIYYGISNNSATNLEYVNTICYSPITVYVYNPTHLLLVYGSMLAITLLVTFLGGCLIVCNGVEQDLAIMVLLKMTLNDSMICLGKETCLDNFRRTRIQLFGYSQEQQKLLIVTNGTFMEINKNTRDKLGSRNSYSLEVDECSVYRKIIKAIQFKMVAFISMAIIAMALNHFYYRYLNGKAPSSSLQHLNLDKWMPNQTIVSIVGNGLIYTGQTFLVIAITTSCNQVFWHALRQGGYTISKLNSAMQVQINPLSWSIVSALQAFKPVSMLVLLAASMPLLSIFAPGSIKISSNFEEVTNCIVLAPSNLSALVVNKTLYDADFGNKGGLSNIFTLGTYLLPIINDTCNADAHCSYDLQFMGPGFDCKITATSNNYSSFSQFGEGTSLFDVAIRPQTSNNLSIGISAQTWDVKLSRYQAADCVGVIRQYTISVSNTNVPAINVTKSQIMSIVHANTSQLHNFAEFYLHDQINLLNISVAKIQDGQISFVASSFPPAGGFGSMQLDGNITWSTNLADSLEEFSQNATLSILSGQILTYNPGIPDILENVTTTCTSVFTAYKYTPNQLFLIYGMGILVAILCTIWGSTTIWLNGTEESIDFSRMLRAILNGRMYSAKDILDGDTVIKADKTPEGALAPINL
ncbi:hypothetical protein SCHPADRAFT_945335 [Schizopora paradoxa]|uniref:Uncharacterized protein n=1 Tax=Schizopora paradoxa TaxID=27342 RepID=A0A0H2R7N1_9AGAM|nr:hypothetical protein SCHPADRAFT_945335 [Schizopora paradoxa]